VLIGDGERSAIAVDQNGWLRAKVGGHLVPGAILRSSNELDEFSQLLCNDSIGVCYYYSESCSKSDSACCYTFIHSVVCRLSHFCPHLNCLTDFGAIWQVHLWGPRTHCLRWGFWPPPQWKGRFGCQTPNQNMPLLVTNEKMIYDSPGGSINQRFCVLLNYFRPCLVYMLLLYTITIGFSLCDEVI